jgi:hypothetical protein
MEFDVILFFSLFGTSMIFSLVGTLTYYAMIGEVNRKRDDASQINYFVNSWTKVFREYRSQYPQGKFAPAFVASGCLALIFGVASFYVLFGLLPAYSVPSR